METVDALALWQQFGPAYFRELSTFGALPEDVILSLLTNGRAIRLNKGEVLYSVGDKSESFFVVLSGTIDTNEERNGNRGALVRRHRAGDDLGFVPMIALIDRPGSATAQTDSIVVEISSEQFLKLHQQNPDAFGLLLLNLARGMARAVLKAGNTLAELRLQINAAYRTIIGNKD
ncbi:cyclic nucleotide-binding domain-containing protein [Microbulbifer hainanensis]|uniref:cyclic nucleotide-binding domain-containing protein n=1 Tax=Microbulbifer hainanensis TaxID=2735675 RepID=UPI00186713F8|nr:cyclic nucleotide-binding domain-containing protein [Microbulbifer hainanensis]